MVTITDRLAPEANTWWKNLIKRLVPTDYHDSARRIYFELLTLPLRGTESLTLSYEDTDVTFDTTTEVAFDWFFPQHADESLHEPPVSKRLFAALEPDSIFLDVGGHVGFFSAFAGRLCPRGEVHVFEIDRACVDAINRTLARNASPARLIVNNLAVAGESGKHVSFSPHDGDNASTNQITADGSSNTVKTVALDDYCRRHDISPDVVKIDAEGAELDVLDGFESTMAEHCPTLFIEVHPQLLPEGTQSAKPVLEQLRANGYTCRLIADRRDTEARPQPVRDGDLEEVCMLLCSGAEDEPWP